MGVNAVVTQYYRQDPATQVLFSMVPRNPMMREKWEEMTESQREAIREIRTEDLIKVRVISLYSFIPLTFFSFFGGYFIAGQMLRPLKKLNTRMSQMNADNLHKRIAFEDTEDEISDLIRNFNKMTSRLNQAFENQKQFVENASHELKTPLTIVHTNIESAVADNKVTKKEQKELLETSLRSVKFMDKLTEDLLLLSLLENQIKRTNFNLQSTTKNIVKQLSKIAKKKNIRIELDINSQKSTFKGNKELIQRSIMNIIENAMKYSPKNSTIHVSLEQKRNTYSIKIKDAGEGISKKDQKRIFDRFYRVDKSRSRKTGGSGLGLSITKKIIELHKGTITVNSKPKKGTTFTISLPL
jgi:signal transduction histidine kinase